MSVLDIEIPIHPTKLSPLHQLGSCLFFLLSLLGMGGGSEMSFVPTFTVLLGARALLPDFPCYWALSLLSSVHTMLQENGAAPKDNVNLTGGL